MTRRLDPSYRPGPGIELVRRVDIRPYHAETFEGLEKHHHCPIDRPSQNLMDSMMVYGKLMVQHSEYYG